VTSQPYITTWQLVVLHTHWPCWQRVVAGLCCPSSGQLCHCQWGDWPHSSCHTWRYL